MRIHILVATSGTESGPSGGGRSPSGRSKESLLRLKIPRRATKQFH